MVDTALDTGSAWNISREHGPLARRAAGIAASLYDIAAIDLRDADEHRPTRPRSRVVGLVRGSQPALTREGGNRILLTYADPASEGALALVLAALAGPQEPIAADPQSLAVFALAERLAASDIPVLINGPTGTGKEVLSRFIHARSPRADKPFIAVNCAAMPETMLEAMLFGHQKGAFTGATAASEGFLRAADGGTLLLDEIAEMPLALQAKLLRALQEQEVVPVGASRAIKVDVRTTTGTYSLGASINSWTKQLTQITTDQSDLVDQQEALRSRLATQFAASETRISSIKSTMSMLTNQIAQWNKSS